MNGDGVEWAVTVEGEGPAVFLFQGFPDSGRVSREQVRGLTAASLTELPA